MPKSIIILHRSVGWDKDSRIRKLVQSFQEKSFDVAAFIWERANVKREIKVGNNATIFCNKIPLVSQNKLRGAAVISALEIIQEFFQGIMFIFLRKPDIIIIQNHRQFLHLFSACIYKLFRRNDVKVVWDLREIPNIFGNFRITRYLFSILCLIPTYIWVMNKGRLQHMINTYTLADKKFHIVPNFCELQYWDAAQDALPTLVEIFLDGAEYVYVQNPFIKERYGYNSIASVLLETDKKIICTGNVTGHLENDLIKNFGEQLISENVQFTGSLQEAQLKPLIDNCSYSIILYDYTIVNNYYCDANRLYQCISRCIPVIVGINPGLSDYVKSYKLGLVTTDDGRDIEALRGTVVKLESMLGSGISPMFFKARDAMAWERNQMIFDLLK